MEENLSNSEIENYLNKLINSYGLCPLINESVLKVQFDHNLYAECVLEVMRYFKLNNKVKVSCFADHLYPCKTSLARVHIPGNLPVYGTDKFKQLKIGIDMKSSAKKHFYAFIRSISHELAHVILYSTRHELNDSEIATDLCTMVFGFSDVVRKGSIYKKEINGSLFRGTIGYLSEDQIRYATNYIESVRNYVPAPKTRFDNIINTFNNILNNLFK